MPSLSIEEINGLNKVTQGRAIAKIDGGIDNGKIIFVKTDDNKKDESNKERKIISMLNDIIEEEVRQTAKDNRMRRRVADMDVLRKSFMDDEKELKDVRLNMIYQQIKSNYTNQLKKEYRCDDCKLIPIPNIDTRECVYIAGPAGSGKSTYTKKYVQSYNKLFPKNPVYLFSKVDDDESLKGIKNLKVIELNEELLEDPIEPPELKNSLCIFDDVSTITNKKIREEIFRLINDILEIGRHNDIYICVTNHLMTDYKNTRTILNECHSITCFPSSGSAHQIRYVLKTYFGLDSRDIQQILKLPTRWCTIFKNYPNTIMYENGVYLL